METLNPKLLSIMKKQMEFEFNAARACSELGGREMDGKWKMKWELGLCLEYMR